MTIKRRIEKLETSTGAIGRGYIVYPYNYHEDREVDEKRAGEAGKKAMDAFIASGGKKSDVKFMYASRDYSGGAEKQEPFKFVPIVC